MRSQLTFFCCLLTMMAFGQHIPATITNALLDRLEMMPGEKQSVIIELQVQADLAEMDERFRRDKVSQKDRIKELLPLLQETAKRSQKDLLQFLTKERHMASQNIRSHWISSLVVIEASEDLIYELANRSDVKTIMWNSPTYVEEHKCEVIRPSEMVVEPDNAEMGLRVIKADKLWAMGYTGYGVIALGSDTGIEPFHPTYNNRWLGLYKPRSSSWYEWNSGNTIPYQCGDHGMHTLGTMLGVDQLTKDTIGVAPQANWVGAPTLCTSGGTSDNIGAFEWSLNPDGDINTTDDMPTVINNSWWDPSQQGNDCSSAYVQPLIVTEMRGVAVIFSAGNDGPEVSTITAPKNINVTEINSFTVGNLNGNSSSLPINNSSSRGPSICGGDSSILIKPEVSAPGTSVRSSELNRTYGNKSGTSMAAPHVAGAMLLLKEAFPELMSEDFKLALYLTARDLGSPGEDNNYGMGVIDVEAAFNYLVDLGNVPTVPETNLDLVGADTDVQLDFCGSELLLSFFVKNAGNDVITSFDYSLEIETYNGTIVYQDFGAWSGSIAKNEITEITMTVTDDDIAGGNYLLNFKSSNPNGEVDPRPLNNALGKLISFDPSKEISLEINGFEQSTACDSSTVTLVGNIPGVEDFYFRWYKDFQGISQLGQGTSYELEMGTEPIELYVDPFTLDIGGEPIPSEGEYTTGNILEFRVFNTVVLNSVDVFVEETGNRFLQIKNSDEVPILTLPIAIDNTGAKTIYLDASLESGEYTMSFFINKPLLEKQGEMDYPYNIGSSIRITGAKEENTFPYFFNWTIEQPYGCEKQILRIEPNGSLGMDLEFDLPTETIYTGESFLVSNNSTGGIQYDWLLDGEVFAENIENPEFTIDEWGSYEITMVATNPNGCQSSLTKTVDINIVSGLNSPWLDLGFEMFPNPANDLVQINLNIPGELNPELVILDNLGRKMSIEMGGYKNNNSYSLDVSSLSPGLYFAEVRMTGRPSWVHKLVIQ